MHKRITINKSSNNLLYISSSKIEDDFVTGLHSHPNLEILLITEGDGHIQSTNRKIAVKKGSIVIINANTKHCEIGEGLRFYAIGIRNTEILLKDTYTKKIIVENLDTYNFQSVLSIYNMMYDEARLMSPESDEIINAAYIILFNLIKRSYRIIDGKANLEDTNLSGSIRQIIDNYFSSDITLDELSHRMNQSKSNLCHTFKKECGISIIEYKIEKELEEACNLLTISDMKISDIALQVGFSNAAYFNKTFKSKYHMTPKEYRIKSRNENEMAH